MFKDYISRENGTPWGETGMTTAKWKELPGSLVLMSELIAMQDGVYLKALLDPYHIVPFTGDPYVHVVSYDGKLYLEDGHTRVARLMLRGKKYVTARVLYLDPKPPA